MPTPMQQGEDARAVTESGHEAPMEIPVQVGDPKRQRTEEAELGSGDPIQKHPRMVVPR